jgi:hypothetical protein
MTSHGCIPFTRLDIFCFCPFLHKQFTAAIKKVKMNDRMKKHALAIVADTAQGFASLITLFIDYREPFIGDKVFHIGQN